MLFIEFFAWWYGPGWQQAAKGAVNLVNKVQLTFSIPVLLRTLFAPWRRIITPPGRSLDDKMRAFGDNIISRAVGFFVRLFVLITALVLVILAAVLGTFVAVIWPLVPPLIVISVVKGIG